MDEHLNVETTLRDRRVSMLSAWVLFMPCLSYMMLADAPLIPVLASFFLVIAVSTRRAVLVTTRSVIYTLTIPLFVAVLLNEVYPVDNDRFFLPMPTEIIFPFVIALGIGTMFFVQTSGGLVVILTSSAFAMMIHGSCVSDPANTRLIIESEFWRNRFWIYGFFLTSQMLAFLPLLYLAQHQRSAAALVRGAGAGAGRRRTVLYTGSVAVLLIAIVATCSVAVRVENWMQPYFNAMFRYYLSSFRSKIVFGKDVDLYRKLQPLVQDNTDRIVLRARSVTPPGYLRGRAYNTYNDGKWTSATQDDTRPLPFVVNSETLATNRFYRGEAEPVGLPGLKVDVIPSRYFYSDVLLAGGTTSVVELIANKLETDTDGVLSPGGWDKHGAYVLENRDRSQTAAFNAVEGEAGPHPSHGVVTAESLAAALTDVVHEIPGIDPSDTLQTVRSVEAFLRENYAYNLRFSASGDRDPVLDFLLDTRSGHCELYATAAALLLRTQGIATRYVTGFVCLEPHPNSDYWIARSDDCHAWVEAWIPKTAEWVLVEPTPASGVPAGQSRSGWLDTYVEVVVVFWKSVYAQIKRGYFAEAVFAFLAAARQVMSWFFWRGPWYLGWGVVLIAVLGVLYVVRRRRVAGFHADHVRELHRILARLDAYLIGMDIRRTETMSIRDTIAAAGAASAAVRGELESVLLEYESLRYRPSPPTGGDLARLSENVSQVISHRE